MPVQKLLRITQAAAHGDGNKHDAMRDAVLTLRQPPGALQLFPGPPPSPPAYAPPTHTTHALRTHSHVYQGANNELIKIYSHKT